MDSGMQTDAVTSLEDALNKEVLPLEPTPLQILAIMDQDPDALTLTPPQP